MMKFINNDTVALVFLGAVAVIGVLTKQETIATAGLGAIGGFIGSKAIEE
jgi:hypothetical protein